MDYMIHKTIEDFLNRRACTLLGVGPMSVNCVDGAIELANNFEVPIMLIASRRQIDSEDFGGGYVNNWSTDRFAEYVFERDKKGKILLARDHGGPWQNDIEKKNNFGLRKAMASAKTSYQADIDAGFQILHIDPSVDIHGRASIDQVLSRIFELYEFCWNHAQRYGKEIIFEIGTEEQSGSTNTQEELDYTLEQMKNFCVSNNLPRPSFVVIQTGTRVMEMRNVGSFDTPLRVARELPAEIQVPKMIQICNEHGILMKEHNTDYLSDEALQWHPRLGIHAANVAPEFGVAETKELVSRLESGGLQKLADEFLELSFASRKWEKWMVEGSKATDRDRAIIAGHYNFSDPKCHEIKARAEYEFLKKNIDLNFELKEAVKRSIFRYMSNFRLVSPS
jgi:tagatose-1,6-bisphosphate aldolase non-catalytic subunit AgaZ/GatZ